MYLLAELILRDHNLLQNELDVDGLEEVCIHNNRHVGACVNTASNDQLFATFPR